MKKLIGLLILVCITIVSFNSIASSEPADTPQGVQVINAVFDKTDAAITKLCEKLSVPATMVWTTLLKQQKIKAIYWTIGTSVSLLIFLFLLIIFIYDKENKDDWWGVPIIFGIIFIALLICCIAANMTAYINPEYGAIKDIQSMLK